jgi:NAD(P)-dependent dehydrogenase (short-subunit alcohol dehydrogenase family)
MDINGSVALVTGANRGLGRAFSAALADAGAATIYAGARDPSSISDPRLTPVELDVTDPTNVAEVAAELADVEIVVNNAGIASYSLPLDAGIDEARRQLEVNYLGLLSMSQVFAPVLAHNGGGALVNMLSVASFAASPQLSTYAASKAAAWSITNTLRVQLRAQGTLVVGVHVGFVDTDLTEGIDAQKLPPQDVAQAMVRALQAGDEEVLVDDISRQVKAGLSDDQNSIYPGIQARFDALVG